MELFFDYACPYCYKGHKNLLELLKNFPDLEIQWKPCEAHPRPEPASIHSDLAIQGMYYLAEQQHDLGKYHTLIYSGLFDEGKDIMDIDFLTDCAEQCGANRKAFKSALEEERYAKAVEEGNLYAWRVRKLNAVPSYRCGDKFIGSHDGILVTKKELETFLSEIKSPDSIS